MATKTTNLGLLLVRLSGALLATHGWPKLFGGGFADIPGHMEAGFGAGVAKMGLPMPLFLAWMAALSELVGGAMVALGIYPRVAATFAALTMAVAAFGAHGGELLQMKSGPMREGEAALLYLFPLLAVALMGGGDWRVERMWTKKKK